MANRKSKRRRRQIIIFSLIGLALAGLTAKAIYWKREPVITVQADKVERRNITEIVMANGQIDPVVEVKISPEVSGEIIALPVKEGQHVRKWELLVKIRPESYMAAVSSAEAAYLSAVANQKQAEADLVKAEAEYKRNEQLFHDHLISPADYLGFQTDYEVATEKVKSAGDQVEVAQASLDQAKDELAKTTILSPLDGTVSRLNSQLGERVVGTAMMTGTEIMRVADLRDMEARVKVGEVDVVLVKPGQTAHLDIDAFRNRKFDGVVTEIADSAEDSAASGSGGQSQEATEFQVKIHVTEKENFRPGMSVTAAIETRYRTNVLSVPIQCVTTRLPPKPAGDKRSKTPPGGRRNQSSITVQSASASATNAAIAPNKGPKPNAPPKPIEVVFVLAGDRVKMVPVERGIADDSYVEIVAGLHEGDQVVSGGFKAISRDLADGNRIRVGAPPGIEAEL